MQELNCSGCPTSTNMGFD